MVVLVGPGGRIDEAAEGLEEAPIDPPLLLQLPLDREDVAVAVELDRLDEAVRRPRDDAEVGRDAVERLVVEAVHLDLGHVAEGIARRLAPRFGRVLWGWLNHTMGGEWTSPAADEGLGMLLAEGYRRIAYFPYGFLADNAESQLEGKIILKQAPAGVATVHLPCLNASPGLAEALARSVLNSVSYVNAP